MGDEVVTFINYLNSEPIHSMQYCHCVNDIQKGKTILLHETKYVVIDFVPSFNGVKQYKVYLIPNDLFKNLLEIIQAINSL